MPSLRVCRPVPPLFLPSARMPDAAATKPCHSWSLRQSAALPATAATVAVAVECVPSLQLRCHRLCCPRHLTAAVWCVLLRQLSR